MKPASAFCIKGCGRQRQAGKGQMCCRCWRADRGLPPVRPRGGFTARAQRETLAGVRASSPLAVGAGQTGETVTVTASDPLADAWAELEASGVPPDALVAPIEDEPNTPPKVGGSRCRHCNYRWPQQYGLCRQCAQALAALAGSTSVRQYLEADHLAREEAKFVGLRPAFVPRPIGTLVVDGVEYEIESSSVRPLEEGEVEREIAAARNPEGWAANGSPWSRTQKR